MPRGDAIPPSMALIHALICAEEKAGKTTWLLEAAEAGFNVLLLAGDVAEQRINDLTPEAKARVYLMDVSDDLVGDVNPRMIQTVADFFVATKFLWNDTKQKSWSTRDPVDPETGACLDEVWEIYPSRLDYNWVLGIDSWTTLQYSAKLAKAADLGVDIADVEKIEQNLYAGVGNRLTNIAITQQKANCHTVVLGHPAQYEKTKSPTNVRAGDVKAKDRIVEWSKMIPISSSNPHGFSIGKFFSDIGWIDCGITGKRTIDFTKTSARTSGGNLNTKGDPRVDHRFQDLVRKIGGTVPDGNQGPGDALIIHPAGTFIPATKKPNVLGSKSAPLQASTQVKPVKGLAGLGGLARQSASQPK